MTQVRLVKRTLRVKEGRIHIEDLYSNGMRTQGAFSSHVIEIEYTEEEDGPVETWIHPAPAEIEALFAVWNNRDELAEAADATAKPRSEPMTPEQRTLRARRAANARWAKSRDRGSETAKGRAAFMERFVQEADPDGTMEPEARERAAEDARRAYFGGLAKKSVAARAGRTDGVNV